jgi:hypothetical protein
MKVLKKTNKLYVVSAVLVIIMAVLLIYIFRDLFSSISVAYDVDIVVPDNELKIDKDQLNKAYDIINNRQSVSLNAR